MYYKPSMLYVGYFKTYNPHEVCQLRNADELPTVTVYRNGIDDSSNFSITVENISTGVYKMTGTIPDFYEEGDQIHIFVAVTVDGVEDVGVVDSFMITTFAELQARFDEIKGSGWTNETLKTIKNTIDTLNIEIDYNQIANEVDDKLSATHGLGSWEGAGGGVTLPAIQGRIYTAVTLQKREIRVIEKDTVRFLFELGDNYVGWSAYFAMKENISDTVYVIPPTQCIWLDASRGIGYINLSIQQSGVYIGEVELRRGNQILTAIQTSIVVLKGVID